MEARAFCVDHFVTARWRGGTNSVLLFLPSDQTESGEYIPAQEIYLHPESIFRLAEWLKECGYVPDLPVKTGK